MDRAAVVAYRIEDGGKLLDRLRREKIDISAAFWMYDNNRERWRFHVVSKSVTSIGIKETYGIVLAVMSDMPDLRIDPFFEVTVLGPREPLARGMLRQLEKHGSPSGTWVEGRSVNDVWVESAYVYPPQSGAPIESVQAGS